MDFHPLDDPDFRQWYSEQDEEHMEYGIYDSRWSELFEQFLDDQKEEPMKIREQHAVTSLQLRKATEAGRVDTRPVPRPSYTWMCPNCNKVQKQRSFGLHPILLDNELRTCSGCSWEGDRSRLLRNCSCDSPHYEGMCGYCEASLERGPNYYG